MHFQMLVADDSPEVPSKSRRIADRFEELPPPVIVIGMHRSGTSLVAGMLSLLGVYMGPEAPDTDPVTGMANPSAKQRRDGYSEAGAFRKVNEALLYSVGAEWDIIDPYIDAKIDPVLRKRALQRFRAATHTVLQTEFLDAAGRHVERWGWKDPRTSLTLDYWLELFPDAKVIHVRREKSNIVDSLVRRATSKSAAAAMPPPGIKERLVRAVIDTRYRAGLVNKLLRRKTKSTMVRHSATDRSAWCRLAHAYEMECLRFSELGPRYTEVRYEDIIKNPLRCAELLDEFAELRSDKQSIERAASLVDDKGWGSAR